MALKVLNIDGVQLDEQVRHSTADTVTYSKQICCTCWYAIMKVSRGGIEKTGLTKRDWDGGGRTQARPRGIVMGKGRKRARRESTLSQGFRPNARSRNPNHTWSQHVGHVWFWSKFLHLASPQLSCHILLNTHPFHLIVGSIWTVYHARDAEHFKNRKWLLFQFARKGCLKRLFPSGSQEWGHVLTWGNL